MGFEKKIQRVSIGGDLAPLPFNDFLNFMNMA